MSKTRKQELEEELQFILEDETVVEASKKEQFDDEDDDKEVDESSADGKGDAKATGVKQKKLKTKPSDAKKTVPDKALKGANEEKEVDEEDDMDDDEEEKSTKKEEFPPKKKDDDSEDDKDDDKKEKKEAYSVKTNMKDIDISQDVDALISNDASLSEEFKTKAATIFEATVKSKVAAEMERIQEEVDAEVALRVEEATEELSEEVDGYLDYVTEQWMKENELAINNGLKIEIAENFMAGIKAVFEENNIEIPEDKEDILETVSNERDELEESLSQAVKSSIALKKELVEHKRNAILQSVSEGLTDTEKEKLASLSEDSSYESKEQYREKLVTIKESYFKKTTAPLTENSDKEFAGTNESLVEDNSDGKKVQNPLARALSLSARR